MYEKVLFPTDFAESAQKTLECIGDIPGVKEVVLLHVIDATHPSKHGWIHGQHIEDAKIRLGEQKEHLKNLIVSTKVEIIKNGNISDAILKMADDEKVSLIAAASIIAKVTRDRLMLGYHKKYPQYGFDKHKGYGTKYHLEMLKKYGPCPIHRKTFARVKELI